MWALLLSILWFPVDIMQRLSQRFVLLGRHIYGAFFGSHPAVKPPSPLIPRSYSPPYKSDVIISMSKSTLISPPPIKPEIKLTINPFIDFADTLTPADTEQCITPPATHNQLSECDSFTASDGSGSFSATIPSRTEPSKQDAAVAVELQNVAEIDRNRNQKRLAKSEKRECGRQVRLMETTQLNTKNTRRSKQAEGPESKKQKLEGVKTVKSVEEITSQPVSGVTNEEETKLKRKRKRSKKKNKSMSEESESNMGPQVFKPNYFVAIQICDEDIHSRIIELQQKLTTKTLIPPWHNLETTEAFKDAMIPVEKLHFTLHVMQIKRDEDLKKANLALEECFQELYQEFKDNPMDLEIEGLDHFRHSVMYAKIKDGEQITRLKKLADLLRAKFEGLNISGDPRPFKPHLTVAKISRSNKLHKKKIRSFPPCFLEGHETTNFGTQRVQSLQLLSMMGEDPVTKYYNCIAQYNFFEDIHKQSVDANTSNDADKNSLESTQHKEQREGENQSNSSTQV